jgi:phage protein D
MAGDVINVASFKIVLNETELSDDLLPDVVDIKFEDEINLPSLFSIKFNIVNFMKGETKGIDLKSFMIGDNVKLYMGIDEHVKLITGEITSLDFSFENSPFMEIRGFDLLHRLRFGTMRRSFKNMKDSDIASSIASEVSLTPEVEATGTKYPYTFQNNMSNYEFLLERAKRIGYEMLMDDKKFIFRKSKENQSPKITLEYRKDLQSFKLQMRALTEGSKVELRGWDIKSKKEVTSTALIGSENTKMSGKESGFEITDSFFKGTGMAIIDNMIIDPDDAQNLAKAKFNIILKKFITGEGKCPGNPRIRAGETIEIKGLGDRISGTYYIISTVHSIKNGAYNTSFKVRRTGV